MQAAALTTSRETRESVRPAACLFRGAYFKRISYSSRLLDTQVVRNEQKKQSSLTASTHPNV